ncbi:Alpha/Beta hydrolase protein [Cercophora newfieldiana]|uniref:Alpha/Beta hydrolase protein n=1 Tax=Cercophora newfieldiana TaxID=92897 RepID=A0AA39YGW0_9PEZI|nr:Alpha/Beta hydrolase protein [Cercophora newfieldiana]
MSLPPPVFVNPVGAHTHTVILLHGRDSTANEFSSELFESEASGPTDADRTLPALFPNIRWVFPRATLLRCERFDNIEMSQWFDMYSTENSDERSAIQMPGLKNSTALLFDVISREEQILPRDRIFLGGISQGFTTVLAAYFAEGKGGFAGLCGFSSWFPLAKKCEIVLEYSDSLWRFFLLQGLFGLVQDFPTNEPITPIFLEHCLDDEVIGIDHGTRMRDMLRRLGCEVEWHEYEDGGHWVNEPLGIDHFVEFLKRHMVQNP